MLLEVCFPTLFCPIFNGNVDGHIWLLTVLNLATYSEGRKFIIPFVWLHGLLREHF